MLPLSPLKFSTIGKPILRTFEILKMFRCVDGFVSVLYLIVFVPICSLFGPIAVWVCGDPRVQNIDGAGERILCKLSER